MCSDLRNVQKKRTGSACNAIFFESQETETESTGSRTGSSTGSRSKRKTKHFQEASMGAAQGEEQSARDARGE